MEQSWDLIIAARKNRRALTEAEVQYWNPSVALAGGHPSLLLDCYNALTEVEHPGCQATSVGSVTVALSTSHRVPTQLPAIVTAEKAKSIVQDALTSRELDEGEHSDILDAGLAWFLPKPRRKGTVSAPFPYLLRLMKEAGGGMYDTVAEQLTSVGAGYEPTKAMEYIAALAVLLKLVGSVEQWVDKLTTVQHGQATREIKQAAAPFMCVWPSPNEPATDFGGKTRGATAGQFKAIFGQVKMQLPSKTSTQGLKEVLNLAWFIGKNVAEGNSSLPVHAFFVSIRRAQGGAQMIELCHAFRVAMGGQITEEDAKKNASTYYGLTTAKTNVTHVISYLNTLPVDEMCEFTYVGRSVDATEAVTEMSSLLPRGVFANW